MKKTLLGIAIGLACSWGIAYAAGFQSLNQITTALTGGYGEQKLFVKNGATVTAGTFFSLWRVGGIPVAGADPTSLTATVVSATTTGALYFQNALNGTGKTKHIINAGATSVTAGSTGSLVILDRLMAYGNINANVNTAQNMTNTAVLTRYQTGTGTVMFLEVTTGLGATPSNATITYTNQDGIAGRTTGAQAMVISSVANRIPNTFLYFPLQAGDNGVRSVQTVQLSAAMGAGVMNLVIAKPLFTIPLALVGIQNNVDLALAFPLLPKLENNHALQMIFFAPTASTLPIFVGQINAAEN